MTGLLHHAALCAGLAALAAVGFASVPSNPLALAITLLIGLFYLMGALELHRFREATATLTRALAQLTGAPASLGAFLEPIHPSLRHAVRVRVEGERTALPGPAMTPYLAGLLVLLGMLGTFLGMIVTLGGTGAAIERSTDLASMRASLAAPLSGLGLAFGTSVAGVAASAMLGLMSAACRRQRLQAAQQLDAAIGGTLRVFSLARQREETLRLLQQQVHVMPALVERMDAMMAALQKQGEASNERLVASHERLCGTTASACAELAAGVDRSLKESLAESVRCTSAALQPVVEATLAGLAREAGALHDTLAAASQRQLDGLAGRVDAATTALAERWQGALERQEQAGDATAARLSAALDRFAETFEQRSASLLESVTARQLELESALSARDEQRAATWRAALASMAAALQDQWQQAGAEAVAQQRRICETLEGTARDLTARADAHSRETLAELARVAQVASEAPAAAAQAIAELRRNVSESLARDTAMAEERADLMQRLAGVLEQVNRGCEEQREAVASLVAGASAALERSGAHFAATVDAQAATMGSAAAQSAASAAEVASLGEALGFAVQAFSASNDKLTEHLRHIEAALGQSMARSDEQLAYYVAQAREVIDLSLASQKQIVEDLHHLAARRMTAGAEA